MTDKIMIDGVDVSECDHYTDGECYFNYFDGISEGRCTDFKNCDHKQLQRKTAECEKLKKKLMQKSEVDMFFNTPVNGWSNNPCDICECKQALDEIEEKAKELITHTPEYDNCYFKDQCGEYCPPKRTQKFDICLYQEVDKILDIISKAKGGE